MKTLQKTRLVMALVLFSLYLQYDCASYEHASNRGLHSSIGDDAEPEAISIRIKLLRSEESGTYGDPNTAPNFLQKNDFKNRKPHSLNSDLVGSAEAEASPNESRFIFETTVSNMWLAPMQCINCTNCTNCVNCINCTSCTNCKNCANCTNCNNCNTCVSCNYCKNCATCTSCISCTNRTGFVSRNCGDQKYNSSLASTAYSANRSFIQTGFRTFRP